MGAEDTTRAMKAPVKAEAQPQRIHDGETCGDGGHPVDKPRGSAADRRPN